MYDPRNTLAQNVAAELEKHFGDKLYRTIIPRNVRLAEAPSHGIPALQLDPQLEGRAGLSRARRRNAAADGSAASAARNGGRRLTRARRRHDDDPTEGTGPRPRRAARGGDEATPRERRCRRSPSTACSPGKYQPRTRMDEAALDELADSIREQGVMQPILVRPVDGGRFEIIAGERRWRAAQRAGLDAKCRRSCKHVPDQAALALALIENIQREDLNPLEEAHGLAAADRRIRPDARRGGEGGRPLAQRGDQPAAPARAREAGAGVSAAAARSTWAMRARCSRCPAAQQAAAAARVVAQGLSVRETERLVASARASGEAQRRSAARAPPIPISRASRTSSPKRSARRSRSSRRQNGAGTLVIALLEPRAARRDSREAALIRARARRRRRPTRVAAALASAVSRAASASSRASDTSYLPGASMLSVFTTPLSTSIEKRWQRTPMPRAVRSNSRPSAFV